MMTDFIKFCLCPAIPLILDLLTAYSLYEQSNMVLAIATLTPIFGPCLVDFIQLCIALCLKQKIKKPNNVPSSSPPNPCWKKMAYCLGSFPLAGPIW